jgi:hypothetical protein
LQFSDFLSGSNFRQSSYLVNPPVCGGELEARSKGQKRDIARLLDGQAEPTLMPCANTRQATRNDFAALGDKTLQQTNVAVGDGVNLLSAKLADLLAPEELAATGAATGGAGRPGSARSSAGAGVTGVSGVSAAGTGCGSVMFSRVRAVNFVSHDISSQVRCAYLRSRLALESLNIQRASVEWKRRSAIVMRCAMR